jgi:hypothetical protein
LSRAFVDQPMGTRCAACCLQHRGICHDDRTGGCDSFASRQLATCRWPPCTARRHSARSVAAAGTLSRWAPTRRCSCS